MCDAWAAEFVQRLAEMPGLLDPGLARTGVELFRTLPATASRRVLLGTDLHAGNVLAAERERWLVIDPKPYVGDPTFDVLQHLLNCEQRLVADPVGLAHRMAGLLGLAWAGSGCCGGCSPAASWNRSTSLALAVVAVRIAPT